MTKATPSGTLADESGEARLVADVDVGERLLGHRDHVAGALLEPGDLVRRVADRPAHLPGEPERSRPPGDEGIDRAPRMAARSATGTSRHAF